MEFSDWERFYVRVLDDMGYSRRDDRHAAELLAELVAADPVDRLRKLLSDEDVVVAGAAPCLEEEVSDLGSDAVVFAADSAVPRLLDAGVQPDAVSTDLDGAPDDTVELSEEGVLAAVHAHGDNVESLRTWLPEFEDRAVVPTCQCRPPEGVHCFGGFTDGDRAAYIADHLGAGSIDLVGFDFEEAEGEKRRKLDWAKELLEVLENRRRENLLE